MFKHSALSSAIALSLAAAYQPVFAQDSNIDQANESDSQVEEIVVTGIRSSLTKALDIKKENIQITDSIVAEDIGKFPDNNVVEALQRVTGVQTTGRGSGEVNGVTIRGLGDISTTVNGRQIFTSTGRSVALADIPASLLKRADVYKTRSADLVEGGIAGQIDVQTQRPFDFEGSKVVLAARGIYQSTSEKTDPNISMLASNRWETGAGEFGALVNLSYAETNYRDENIWIGSLDPYDTYSYAKLTDSNPGTTQGMSTTPGSTYNGSEYYLLRDAMGFTDFTGTRKRPAASLSLQWAPNDSSEYLFETFYNGYRNQSFNSLVFVNTNGASHFSNPELYEGTNVIKKNYVNNASMFTSGDGSKGNTDSWVYALGGNWDISDKLKLKSELVYQTSEYDSEFFAMRTTSVRDRLVVDFNDSNGLPLVAFLDDPETADVNEGDLTNAADWNMDYVYDNADRDKGDATTWTFDGTYDADWGMFHKLKFGLRYDQRAAQSDYRSQSGGTCSDNGEACVLADIEGLANVSSSGFFEGRAYVPSNWLAADGNYLLSHKDYIRGLYGLQLGGSSWEPANSFDISETNIAAYAQADYDVELGEHLLDGQIGVRVVNISTDMHFMENPSGDLQTWEPISASATDTRALPNLVVRYHFTDELLTRFTYGQTIRRPEFGDLNPAITYSPTTTGLSYGTASGGNPNLKPAESTNYDWSLEYYFGKSSSVYGVLFRRDISGLVASSINTIYVDYDGVDGAEAYRLSQPDNTGKGVLEGMELGLVYFPDNLPGLLNGFGVQASFTWLDGHTNDPVFVDGALDHLEENPLIGVSDSSYSVALAYDKDKFTAHLSYVWRDSFLTGYNTCCSMPSGIYSAPEASLDMQMSYNVTDDLTLTFDATNLTDEIYKGYYTDDYLYNNGASIYARTFAVGMRWSF